MRLSTNRSIGSLVCLAVLLCVGWGGWAMWTEPPQLQAEQPRQGVASSTATNAASAVTVVQPTVEPFRRVTRQPAHVEPYERTQIYAKAAGFVSKVHVDIGHAVEKDQPLAELWIPEMQQERRQKEALREEAVAAMGQAEAAATAAESVLAAADAKLRETQAMLGKHEAEVKLHRSEHDRFQRLVQDRALNGALLDEKLNQLRASEAALAAAQAAVESAQAGKRVEAARLVQAQANLTYAQARLKVAEANLKHVEVLIDYAVLRAPYSGIVIHRGIDTGDFAQSAADAKAEPLFTLVRVDPLRIITDIPESESSAIRIGQAATLTVDALAGQELAGRIERIAGVLDPKSRTLRVEIELTDRTDGLRPGMYGAAAITLADYPQAMHLPARCLGREGGTYFVMCTESGFARKRPVTVVHNDGARAVITEGLRSDATVIASRPETITPDQRITIAARK